MKLELKHLAAYLPYGLNIKILNYQRDYVGIEYSEITGYYFIGSSLHVNYKGGSTGKSIDIFKPILRPLSDLTKEIEVNGEKFVPIDWFEHDSVSDYFDGNIWVKFLFEDGKCGDLDFIPYGMIQKLLEWHFDIYGLIDAGLAIDINTL